ncbi:MAG: DNA-binding response regulator [Caldilineae bacterium]|nr:MAG: DNA-binding response regulator [Caldilineae bacterium]
MAKKEKQRILLIEDEPHLRKTLKLNLKRSGYKVSTAGDGLKGLELARSQNFDLLIVDLMLPGMDGISLIRSVRRESTVPIIVLTARTGEMDKIVGLESGADDYITKPFSLGELLARVRSQLRRAGISKMQEVLVSGSLRLDLVSRRVEKDGVPLKLSPKEFSLLAELMRHEGAVLSRDLLLSRVWGYDYVGDTRTVDVHIRWLREKVEADPSHPSLIQTVRGVGYRFEGGSVEEDEEQEGMEDEEVLEL